jgi:hypothetical protein
MNLIGIQPIDRPVILPQDNGPTYDFSGLQEPPGPLDAISQLFEIAEDAPAGELRVRALAVPRSLVGVCREKRLARRRLGLCDAELTTLSATYKTVYGAAFEKAKLSGGAKPLADEVSKSKALQEPSVANLNTKMSELENEKRKLRDHLSDLEDAERVLRDLLQSIKLALGDLATERTFAV